MEQGIEREKLGSRLGFLLLSAGCAIGLGNVWRFPFITGAYGGAAFVLIYLVFLVILGLPIMVMEFSVGRAAKQGIGLAFRKLEPKGTFWHLYGYGGIIGCYVLMMFYTTVTGWMLSYCWYMGSGQLSSLTPEQIGAFFGGTLGDPFDQVGWMAVTVVAGFLVCSMGLQRGVERITKIMMGCLLVVMLFLVIRSVTLPGAEKGILFYLKPDFGKMFQHGIWEPIYAAMGQAFFSLSLAGSGTVVYGSYLKSDVDIISSARYVAFFDTLAALLAGLAIIPTVFAYGMEPDSGPGLLFITIPSVIRNIPFGRLFALLFFLAVLFAGATSLVNLLESPVEALQSSLGLGRTQSLILVGTVTAGVGLFVEGDLLSPWMDGISIYVLPLGALLAGVAMFWICGKKFARDAVQQGRKRPLGRWFEPMTRYVFCGVALGVYILGIFFGGIG